LAENFGDLEQRIISCRLCPRLVEWRERVGREKRRAYGGETYWAKPVPGFGDPRARVLGVGLAPGAHGSNRTGRMFTGDASGDFLFPALHRAGFADRRKAVASRDGLALRGLFLTAVCRCVPPGNRPTAREIHNCLPYLAEEIRLLGGLRVLVALGRIACDGLIRLLSDQAFDLGGRLESGEPGVPVPGRKRAPFAHGLKLGIWLPGETDRRPAWLVASYHPSRQNTQTGRLTRLMFDRIWRSARALAYPEELG
jgi:uracil-DNA glycosylase family 4